MRRVLPAPTAHLPLQQTKNYCPANARNVIPTTYARYVPVAYPIVPSSTPTGASAGWNAAATTGADAGPPMLLCEPMAK